MISQRDYNSCRIILHLHDEHSDSKAPAVDRVVVACTAAILYLWRHVQGCSTLRLEAAVSDDVQGEKTTHPQHRICGDELCESEIGNLDDGRFVESEENVLGLEISMGYAFAVNILEGIGHTARRRRREHLPSSQDRSGQRTASLWARLVCGMSERNSEADPEAY